MARLILVLASLSLILLPAPAAVGQTTFGSLIGGSDVEEIHDLAVNGSGHVWVVGQTWSYDLPVGPEAAQPRIGDEPGARFNPGDAFVARLTEDASSVVWMTYLGGRGRDYGAAVTPTPDEGACVTGFTDSPDFPLRSPAQRDFGAGAPKDGSDDAFVACFDAKGNLVFSTYLGGSANDSGSGITAAENGSVLVVGTTYSAEEAQERGLRITGPAWQSERRGPTDMFVAVFSPNGVLQLASYWGGTGREVASDVTFGSGGWIYVTGSTTSHGWARDGSNPGPEPSVLIAGLHAPTRTEIVRLFGRTGRALDEGRSIATEGRNVWVTGITAAKGLQQQPRVTWRGSPFTNVYDAFLWMGTDTLLMQHSFVIGGNGHVEGFDVAVDLREPAAFVAGRSQADTVLGAPDCAYSPFLFTAQLFEQDPSVDCLLRTPRDNDLRAGAVGRGRGGRVYLAGGVGPTLPPDLLPRPLPRAGAWDAFVAVCCDLEPPPHAIADLWVRHASRPEQAFDRGDFSVRFPSPTLPTAPRARLVVTVENVGTRAGRFALMAHEEGADIDIAYRSIPGNIGPEVRSPYGWRTPNLDPGESVEVRVDVSFPPAGPGPALLPPGVTFTVVPGVGDYRPADRVRIAPAR